MTRLRKKNPCVFLAFVCGLIWILTVVLTFGQQSRPKSDDMNEREKQLRERALYIADEVAASKDIDDNLERAHMRADFASLMCSYGERARAVDIFRKSLADVAMQLFEGDPSKKGDASLFEPAARIADAAALCDPASMPLVIKDLENLRASESGNDSVRTATEPQVVPDDLWGTKPSARRQLSAEILARAAYAQLSAGRLDEAERLLLQSSRVCVVTAFVTNLVRLEKDRPESAARLYVEAGRQVQANPSGAEVSALSFGLRPLAGIRSGQPFTVEPDNQTSKSMIEAYLDALTVLVRGQGSTLVSQSADILRMVRASVPLYSVFRPSVRPQIEVWIFEATRVLPPREQAIVEQFPFARPPLAEESARIEEIASRTTDAKQRDQAYASLASMALSAADFGLGSEFASKVSDSNLRIQLQDEVAYRQILFALNKGQDARLMVRDITRVSSLPMRVKLYTQLATAVPKQDVALAREALEEAAALAAKLDISTVQSHLLLGIANAFAGFDSIRGFEVLREAVKSVNRHRDQPASRWGPTEVDTTTIKYDSTLALRRVVFEDPEQYRKPYDLSAFRKLARVDFNYAILAAAYLDDKSLRAAARYEVCAGILTDAGEKKTRSSAVTQ